MNCKYTLSQIGAKLVLFFFCVCILLLKYIKILLKATFFSIGKVFWPFLRSFLKLRFVVGNMEESWWF